MAFNFWGFFNKWRHALWQFIISKVKENQCDHSATTYFDNIIVMLS